MCLHDQAPAETADAISLSQKVPIAPPEATALTATEEEKPLPEWSEKVASGILTGDVKLHLLPKPLDTFLCSQFARKDSMRLLVLSY